MIDAVFDTNVLASAVIRKESVPGLLLTLWRAQRFTIIMSNAILDELERTLSTPYFVALLSPDERSAVLRELTHETTHVEIVAPSIPVPTHPEDDLILATAVRGRAHYLVTGDRQLQLLDSHEGVAIVNPRAFLAALGGD